MTDFQISLRNDLDTIFRSFSRSIAWAIEGKNEAFYHGSSGEGNAQIWIYEDEAECRFGEFHRICELADFESLEQLRAYFLDTVRQKLAGNDDAVSRV